MRVVEQWDELERRLPAGWDEARVLLAVERGDADRAAALLGPANPGRRRDAILVTVRRGGGATSPEGFRRLVGKLDRERVAGRLEVVGTTEDEAPAPVEAAPTLLEAWQAGVAGLPADWSDLLAQAEFRASDQVDRAALLMSPLNPGRPPDDRTALVLRFRCASRFGYGASVVMVERCLARCDAESIRGTVRLLWALSDTHPVSTQGPVWYAGGRAQ